MTQTIYLHIGMHKTGSTAIQSAFAGFDDGQTKYADLGYENHSIPFYTAFSGHHQDYHIWKAAGFSEAKIEAKRQAIRKRIRKAVENEKRKNIIFSGEDISYIPPVGIHEIHDLFSTSNAQTIALIYVRSPASYIASAYQQAIRPGENPTAPHMPLYRMRIEKFIEAFGRENVVVREFSRNRLVGGDIVKDFSNLIGVRTPRLGSEDNGAFSTEAVRIVFQLNLLLEPFSGNAALSTARENLLAHIRTLFPGRFDLPDELIAGLVDEDDVAWLHEMTSIDFRNATPVASEFDPNAFKRFISQPDETTLQTLRDYVQQTCGVPSPPERTATLIARYFMCFLKNGYPHGNGFDPERYLTLNPDVAKAGADPFQHFVRFGFKEGRRT